MERAAGHIEVHHSPTRCPYCHDDCAPEDENVVCNECLARHHQAWWDETGKCGSCGHSTGLAARKATAPDQGVEALRIESELARLDREWQLSREQYQVQGRRGSSVPGISGVVGGLIGVAFGVFWTLMAVSAPGAPVFFPIFGCAFVLFGVVKAFTSYQKMNGYRQAEQDYHRRRSKLLSHLERHRHDA